MFQTVLLSIFAADLLYKHVWSDTNNHPNINNLFTDMTSFIEKQREREDKIRFECKQEKEETSIQSSDYIPNIVTINLINTYEYFSIYLMEEKKIKASTYDELLKLSYDETNIQKKLIFEDNEYTLFKSGTTINENMCGYGNQRYCIEETPVWTLDIGTSTLYITKILNNTHS